MDVHTKAQRRRNMQAVKVSGSLIERTLRNALSKEGLRYRLNVRKVFGKPDLAFMREKVAVFCDSEFWHGKDWSKKQKEIKTNKKFWCKKIGDNIKRDQLVNRELKSEGWKVVRFWGKDVISHPEKCVFQTKQVLCNRREYKK